ncbi:MAG: hypothetical protein HYX91_06670 [Chloroflexi bacterium]|nr:hypothetical protein [Chloroflexota bacterium]
MEERVGEVIEASTVAFTAQCYELYCLPPLGSLVSTRQGEVELYGIVHHAATGSLEPGRRPIARGRDEASEEDIYRSSPQLLKLLQSEFCALVVGHREGGEMRHYLPPQPARIHGFVYLCGPEEVREFSQSFGFLNLLLNAHLQTPPDELVAASLRRMGLAREDRHDFLVRAGRELALLIGDFNQLKSILGRLR